MIGGAGRPGLATLILVLVLTRRNAFGQAFVLQGGSSSLFDAHGATIEARGSTISTALSIGQIQGEFVVGVQFKRTTRALTFRLGDDVVDFLLPTDVFGGGRYVPVRGAGVEMTRGKAHVMAMVGGTSTTRGGPFFHGARWGSPVGLLFVDRGVGERWHLFSRNAFSTRQTSISGVEWRPTDTLKLGAAGGAGAGRPYVATSATVERGWISGNAAYVHPHPAFSRLVVDSPTSAELENENLSLTLRPRPWWSVSAGRQHLVSPLSGDQSERATVNRVGGNLNAVGFRLGGTVFDSRAGPSDSLGISLSLARSVTESVDVLVEHFRSVSKDGASSNSIVASLREAISPRVGLVQVVSGAGNRPSLNIGGQFLSNPLTVDVSYQTVYAPFRVGNPFVQAFGFDLRLHLMGSLQLQAGTYTTPDGRLKYTISGSQWVSRSGNAGSSSQGFRFPRYLVRGRVIDVTQAGAHRLGFSGLAPVALAVVR